jgi:hypothetical protein
MGQKRTSISLVTVNHSLTNIHAVVPARMLDPKKSHKTKIQ